MNTSTAVFIMMLCPLLLIAQDITFSSNPIAKGLVIERLDTLGMALDVTMDGSDDILLTQKTVEYRHYTMTILETDLEEVTEYRLDVHSAWQSGVTPGGGKIELPIQMNTYIVRHGQDTTTILKEDGTEASSEEYTAVTTLSGNSEAGVLRKVLDGKNMKLGESIQLQDELLESFRSIVGNRNLDMKDATLKLVDIRTDQDMRCGVFDIRMKLAGTQSGVEMDLDLVAEAVIAEKSMWPISITMKGDMRGVALQQGMTLMIQGVVGGAKTSTYTTP